MWKHSPLALAFVIRPLPRLKALAKQQDVSVQTMAGVIGRSESYLRKRLNADTYLLDLPTDEIHKLARFFGVDPGDLGG